MNKYAFEVHTYGRELNKIFYNGKDITRSTLLKGFDKTTLTKDYDSNVRMIRKHLSRPVPLHFVHIKAEGIMNDFVKQASGSFTCYKQLKKAKRQILDWFVDGCVYQISFKF